MTLPAVSPELLRKLDVRGPRYTSYPTVPVWSESFRSVDHEAAITRAGVVNEPLSLYVHIPFCAEMCSYCGCNVIITKDRDRVDAYLGLVIRELSMIAARLDKRRSLARVHFGGGTPTFLDERQLERLWTAISTTFKVAHDAELAIEIDPAITRVTQLELLRSLGFSRLSMGVQDFDPDVQAAVRRVQTVEETRRLIEVARAQGWKSVNFDMIYGLPLQTPVSWATTLDKIVALEPDRMAVFSFAHVPELKTHQRRLSMFAIPFGAAKLELFRQAHERFTTAGYRAIGLDHFARPSDELAIAEKERRLWRDFQGYTVWRGADTVGVGLSAISSIGGAYIQNDKLMKHYADKLNAGHLATERGHVLDEDDRVRAGIITQLMCNFWVNLGVYGDRFRRELDELAPLVSDGIVTRSGAEITVTPLGRSFVRNVAMIFDTSLRGGPASGSRRFSGTV